MNILGIEADAIVFDLDGTLIDSESAIVSAASAAFLDVRCTVSELQVADHLGAPLEELYAIFVGDGDAARMRKFIAHYIERHDEHPDRFPPALPGVSEALAILCAAGVPLAVATTKPSARAVSQLEGAGLLERFVHVQGTDPGMRAKPAPDVVIKACAGLGIEPSRSVMVGDTFRDVDAAKAAGARAIVVAYHAARAQAASTMGAEAVVTSLMELVRR